MKERPNTELGWVFITFLYIIYGSVSSNIALKKNTTQSSIKYNGDSKLAVDGNRNPYYANGSCTHTASDLPFHQWWMVDLEEVFNITEIVVYSRQDPCCNTWLNNFTIEGGVNGSNNTIDYFTCYTQTNPVGPVTSFIFSQCAARYVRFRRIHEFKTVILCEVEVFGSSLVSAQNIAFDKSTTQISTNYGGTSDRAVDGIKNQAFDGQSCTHTVDNDVSDWWQVDLENIFNVTEITIYGRDEQCCGSWLYNFAIDAGLHGDNNIIDYSTCYTQIPNVGTLKTFILQNCSARYIRIRQLANKDPLILCEVEVFGKILFTVSSINSTNIALNKNTVQVSTNHGGHSNLAVDGNKDQFFTGRSCTHTVDNDGSDWWRVDLEDTYNVTEVVIYGRMDTCCDFWLFNFTIDGGVEGCNSTIEYNSCHTQVNDMGIVKSFLFNNCSARYIRVRQMSNTFPLILCEVEVYGTLLSLENTTCLEIEGSTVSSSIDDTSILLQDSSCLTVSSHTSTAIPLSIVVTLPCDSCTPTDGISSYEIPVSKTLTKVAGVFTELWSDSTDNIEIFEDLYTSSDSYATRPTSTEATEYALAVKSTSTTMSFIMKNSSMPTETFVVDSITATTIWGSSSSATLEILANTTMMTTRYIDGCRCRCKGSYEKFLEEIFKLQKVLAINTTALSSKFRKKNSMNDERFSAISIGYTGVAILVMFFGLFVLNDVLALLKFAYNKLFASRK